MNRWKWKIGIAVLSTIALVLVFQNCSGIGSGNSSSENSSANAATQSLNSIQIQAQQLMQNPPSTVSQLQALIQKIQSLLSQVQSVLNTNPAPDVQTLAHALILQLTIDINLLNQSIAGLNNNNSCSFNGQTVASGANVTAYQAGSVPAAQTCQSEIRTCNSNGQLSGSYTFAACTVQAPPPSVAIYTWINQSRAVIQGLSSTPVPPLYGYTPYPTDDFFLYSQSPGSGSAVYYCGAFPSLDLNSCPPGSPSNTIVGYISNVQLANSVPLYQLSGLGQPSLFATQSGCINGWTCNQIGWVPSN